jgi:putative molybdopterin biosynthesis protein
MSTSASRSLSTQEVADMLHVSRSTIYDLIRRGELHSYRIGRKVRFTQDDVDAYIARARHEHKVRPVQRVELESTLLNPEPPALGRLILSGQDVLLDLLANHLAQAGVGAERCYLNSFEGLLSLYQGRVDTAACHLYDTETNSYNVPFVRKLMPYIPAVLVNLSYRAVGFYVADGNPKGISGWVDLRRDDLSILNRAPGSSPRILLDGQLRLLGISPNNVRGYETEMKNHLTMAAAIAAGEADLAVGTERVSRQIEGLDFLPLMQERVDLVLRRDFLDTPAGAALLETLASHAFRRELRNISGNDYRDLGKIVWEG